MKALRRRFGVLTLATGTWHAVPLIITAASFFFYTVVEEKPLVPSIAFTALTLINRLRLPLDRIAVALAQYQQSKASFDRIEAFLDDHQSESPLEHFPRDEDRSFIGFKNATLSWEVKYSDSMPSFKLSDIDVRFYIGGLNVVTGPTGSGKSSLLMGLLGELNLLEGSVHLPRYNGIGYCAQEAWLLNKSVQENIIFSSRWDEIRYRAVLEACALTRDLQTLDQGDQTFVGDRGIALSGGQKQRVSLARAVYSNSKILLLDDCLSAVDSQTAQHIFDKLFLGPLLASRTVVLVTHSVAICAPESQHIVMLEEGKIAAQGSYEQLIASCNLEEEEYSNSAIRSSPSSSILISSPAGSADITAPVSVDDFELSDEQTDIPESKPAVDTKVKSGRTDAGAQSGAQTNEAVNFHSMKLYCKLMGPWYYWILVLSGFAAESTALVATNNWIRVWSNAYYTTDDAPYSRISLQYALTAGLYPYRLAFATWQPKPLVASTSAPGVNSSYFLGIYGLLGLLFILVFVLRNGLVFKGSLNASRAVHQQMLTSVLGATFTFFDTTQTGQIVNRCEGLEDWSFQC